MRLRTPSRSVLGYLAKGEYVVLEMKQHWARVLPAVASVVLGFILVVIAGLNAPAWMGWMSNAAWWIWLVLFIHFLWRVIEWKDETFAVTNRRLILVHGIFVRKVAMMPLSKITDMSYNRSLMARLLGYGTFVLESAGQDQALSEVNFVRDPDARYREICGLIFHDDAPRPPEDVEEYLEDDSIHDERVDSRMADRDDDERDPGAWDSDVWDGDDTLVGEPREAAFDEAPSPYRRPRARFTARRANAHPTFLEDADPAHHELDRSLSETEPLPQSDWRSADFDGWEGSPRARRGHAADPADTTDPFGIPNLNVTNRSQRAESDADHTYTDANQTVGDPADGDDSAWMVSREHATRPQSVDRSRNLGNPSRSRDDQ